MNWFKSKKDTKRKKDWIAYPSNTKEAVITPALSVFTFALMWLS